MPSIRYALGHSRADKAGAFRHPGPYDRRARRHLDRLYDRVAADVGAAGLPEGARVLDAGTGPGRVPLKIAEVRPDLRVEGIDLSEEMIAHATRLAAEGDLTDRVGFAVADVAGLPHPDGSFDLIVSSLSQHHWKDREKGVRELLRVLKPTGQIWIYDIRFALRRAQATARDVRCDVQRRTVRPGPLSLGLITRLTIKPPA